MVCVNCGKNLIRGYAFCMECGSPVPHEVLEEGGMPGRTDDEGRPKPEADSVPASEKKDGGEKKENTVSEVRSSMPGIEPLGGNESSETLVFCPNCGMHMQSDPYRCNKCGMKLGEKPKNVPMSAGGVPLMNIDPIGGSIGIGGGLDGISESDIEQITGFMSGTGNIPIFAVEDNSTPDLFGSDISANDFAALSEQLANFSAANEMPGIEAIDAPKHEPITELEKRPVERRVDDFNMGGDSAAVSVSDDTVPVIGNYSMDEKPDENVNLDPYKFLNASMEDAPEPLFSKPQTTAPVKEPEPAQTVQAVQPLTFTETAPVIEETEPVIGEFVSEQPAVQAPTAPKAPETPAPFSADDFFSQPVPPPMPRQNTAPVQSEPPRGNLFRCQFCGQSMYDTDKFCPSCGASYKNGSASPKNKSKAPFFIGLAAAVIVLGAAGYFAMNILNNGNGGESAPPTSSSSVIADTSEVEESSQPDESSVPEASADDSASTSSPSNSMGTPGGSSRPSSTGGAPSSTGASNGSSRHSSTGGAPSFSR